MPLADQTSQILRNKSIKNQGVGILGVYTPQVETSSAESDNDTLATSAPQTPSTQSGSIVVFGDSSCFDDASDRTGCNWLLGRILQVTNFRADPIVELPGSKLLEAPFMDPAWNGIPPARADGVAFSKHSRIVGANKPLTCPPTLTQSHLYEWEDKDNLTGLVWEAREIAPRAPQQGRPTADHASKNDSLPSFGFLPMYPKFQFVYR